MPPKFGTERWREKYRMRNIAQIFGNEKVEPALSRLGFQRGVEIPLLTNLLLFFFVLCGSIFDKRIPQARCRCCAYCFHEPWLIVLDYELCFDAIMFHKSVHLKK